MSLELVMIAVLLSTEPDTTLTALDTVLGPACRAAALDAELIDQRELLPADTSLFHVLWQRRVELYNAPMLIEAQRFPDVATLRVLCDMNRAYRALLQQRRAVDAIHEADIDDALCETDAIFQVIYALLEVKGNAHYITIRRQSLATTRRLLGDVAFYSGTMPPPVPLRHIPRK